MPDAPPLFRDGRAHVLVAGDEMVPPAGLGLPHVGGDLLQRVHDLMGDKEGERTMPLTATDKTNVMIETDEDEVATTRAADGHDVTVRMPNLKQGALADLKVGRHVTVSTHDNKVTTLIRVRRAPKP